FADPYPPLLIPNNNQGGKIKPLAAFDDLGHTINKNNLVLEIQFVRINLHTELARPIITSGRRDSLSAPEVFISISPTHPRARQDELVFPWQGRMIGSGRRDSLSGPLSFIHSNSIKTSGHAHGRPRRAL